MTLTQRIGRIIVEVERRLAGGKPKRFGADRFAAREKKLRGDYHIVAAALMERLDFNSAFDLGCANGFLMAAFHDAGKRVGGVELSPAVKDVAPPDLLEYIEIGDFSLAMGRWDLACCVEVAEHIEPERSEELVEKVVGLAERWIYFTAAPPGQRGYGHINCRPHEDWLRWFAERGWTPDPRRTDELRNDLRNLRKARWLRRNSFILAPVTAAEKEGDEEG